MENKVNEDSNWTWGSLIHMEDESVKEVFSFCPENDSEQNWEEESKGWELWAANSDIFVNGTFCWIFESHAIVEECKNNWGPENRNYVPFCVREELKEINVEQP